MSLTKNSTRQSTQSSKSARQRNAQQAAEPPSGLIPVKYAPVTPTESWTTSSLDGAVRVRLGASTPMSEVPAPVTVHEMFEATLRRSPNLPALICKRGESERNWSYLEYYRECVSVAKSLVALGIPERSTVCILGFNAPEWFFANIGAIFAGCIPAGIYATNSSEACQYVLQHCGATVLVLENDNQMAKLASMPLEEMKLEVVVQYTGKPRPPAVARANSTPSTPSTPVPVANGSVALPNGAALGNGTDSQLKDLSPNWAAVVANGEVKSASTTSDHEASTSLERPNSTSPSFDSGRTQSPASNAERKGPRFMDWSEFVGLGRGVSDAAIAERLTKQAPNECAELIYTNALFLQSGTTGTSKGAMLSHDNITWLAIGAIPVSGLRYGSERSVSYLPLSHIAAQIADIYLPIACAACIHFARPDALKGTLALTMQEARPTYFFGVPRVYEKFQEKILAGLRAKSALAQKIAHWARGVGLKSNYKLMNSPNASRGLKYKIAKTMVFSKLRERLGLTEARLVFTAAAPIMKETLDFFLSLDLQVLEIFGMTESTGPHTFSMPNNFRVGSCGIVGPGLAAYVTNPDEDGEGELLLDGRNTFMGYLNSEEETRNAFNSEFRLRTGDLAKVDKKQFFTITGRIKELVITAGGENVAPVPIENRLKVALPELVANCMMVGDRRKFLSMLVTLKVDINLDTLAPTPNLTADARAFLKSKGIEANTLADLMNSSKAKLDDILRDAMKRVNAGAISSAQRVQKWLVIERGFSVPGGELGPTLKLRRPIVLKQYRADIERLYAEADGQD